MVCEAKFDYRSGCSPIRVQRATFELSFRDFADQIALRQLHSQIQTSIGWMICHGLIQNFDSNSPRANSSSSETLDE
jgi:hypothetical protein